MIIFLLGCTTVDTDEVTHIENEVTILLLNTYGERVKTKPIGLNTEYITVYIDDTGVYISDVKFTTKYGLTFNFDHVTSETVSDLGKFYHIGYDNPDFSYLDISEIEISTNIGNYIVETNIQTMTEKAVDEPSGIDIIGIDQYDLVFLDDTLVDDYRFSIDLSLLEDNVSIQNIELFNSDHYPSGVMIENVWINNDEFEVGNESLSYNEGILNFNITMTDYYLGHYVFKVTYQYESNTYYTYTSALSIILSVDEYKLQETSFNNRLQEYIDGNLASEFVKKG